MEQSASPWLSSKTWQGSTLGSRQAIRQPTSRRNEKFGQEPPMPRIKQLLADGHFVRLFGV
ncbi:MAG: hypothetical protein U0794_23085, partial [Isosphaeraceae bacterium]